MALTGMVASYTPERRTEIYDAYLAFLSECGFGPVQRFQAAVYLTDKQLAHDSDLGMPELLDAELIAANARKWLSELWETDASDDVEYDDYVQLVQNFGYMDGVLHAPTIAAEIVAGAVSPFAADRRRMIVIARTAASLVLENKDPLRPRLFGALQFSPGAAATNMDRILGQDLGGTEPPDRIRAVHVLALAALQAFDDEGSAVAKQVLRATLRVAKKLSLLDALDAQCRLRQSVRCGRSVVARDELQELVAACAELEV